METRRCVVHGRVQGVGFRWFVVRNAESLGVTGTVRNRSDGAVEAVFQAPSGETLDRMLDRVRQGPSAARVDSIDVETVEPDRTYDTLSIVR